MNKPLKFYDLQAKKSFTTSNYKLSHMKTRTGSRTLALTKGPSGYKCSRIVGSK